MSAGPVVSVVTPTKNRLVLLRETMDSVAAQTFASWEMLVVDDGSDDGTAEEVSARGAEDPRIRYLARGGPVSGANACRNLGLREARADLVVFLDSDDLLEPDALRRRVEVMKRNRDIDFAVFRTGVFLERPGDLGRELDPEMIGDDLLRFLYFEVPWQTTASTWRRASLAALGGFDEHLPSWQDVDLHVRAIAGGLRYLRFPNIDHHMRWQEDEAKTSAKQRRSPEHLQSAEGLLEKFEAVLRDGPGMNWARQRALCSLYFFVAERWIAVADVSASLRFWRRARDRRLSPLTLYIAGAFLLWLHGARVPCERLIHKWKGWVQFRTNRELVKP